MLILFSINLIGQVSSYSTIGGLPVETPLQLPLNELVLSSASSDCQLPDYIDNFTLSDAYFPDLLWQKGHSCVHVSEISYCLTYEMNRLRDVPAGDWTTYDANLYSYYYSYNFKNDGSGSTSTNYLSGYNVANSNGIPMYNDYYNVALEEDSTRYKYWMTGYDKYLNGKSNTINGYSKVTFTTDSDCLINLKHWLSDHNEGENASGGVATVTVYTDGLEYGDHPTYGTIIVNLSDDPQPQDEGHALTVVGYNDNIGFDYNGDQQITTDSDINGDGVVDLMDCEIGALKVANSWWPTWGDFGFAWLPYKLLPTNQMQHNYAYVCHAEVAELPDYELKVGFSYESRGSISLAIGTTSDAITDLGIMDYEIMDVYHKTGGIGNPMQGINTDPIELALNFGALYDDVDFGRVFFKIHDFDQNDLYDGEIQSLSLIDYRWGETFEIFCEDENVPIVDCDVNAGNGAGNTVLYINYDLLPHHEEKIDSNLLLYSDMVSRFEPTVSNNATLTVSDITIDMYESTIKIEDGSSLIIKDNAVIHAKKRRLQDNY